MRKSKILMTQQELDVWVIAKQVYINEDQWPNASALAEQMEVPHSTASTMLTRFRYLGLLVKNCMGGYRLRRGAFEIVIIDEEAIE